MLVDGVEVLPFPSHPRTFRRRGEYVNWLLRTYPGAPEYLYVAAAGGSFELYQQEVAKLREVVRLQQ